MREMFYKDEEDKESLEGVKTGGIGKGRRETDGEKSQKIKVLEEDKAVSPTKLFKSVNPLKDKAFDYSLQKELFLADKHELNEDTQFI